MDNTSFGLVPLGPIWHPQKGHLFKLQVKGIEGPEK